MEEDSNDMDSLFEGMVWFTPSQFSDQLPPETSSSSSDHQHHQNNHQPPPLETTTSEPLDENLFSDLTIVTPLQPIAPDSNYTTAQSGSDRSIDATKTSTSGPSLEREVQVPSQIQNQSPITRQVSRKKKRAAGLRIGYGRDDNAPSPASIDHSPVPVSPSVKSDDRIIRGDRLETSNGSVSATSSVVANKEEDGEEGEETQTLDVESVSSQNEVDSKAFDEEKPEEDHSSIPDETNEIVRKEETKANGDIEEPLKGGFEVDVQIEMGFEGIKTRIEEKLNKARELAASLSANKKELIRKRRKAAESVNLAFAKYKELEKSLEEACEAEDFEMAEKLSEKLAEEDNERKVLIDVLRGIEAECDAVDAKMEKVLGAQIDTEEECVAVLESFSKDATTNGGNILENARLRYSEEMGQWNSSSESLEAKRMELEIESHLVNDAHDVLNDSIDKLTEDDKREKENLFKRKETLAIELEKLLALVKEKEMEIAQNDSKIEAVEKRIESMVSGYQDARMNISAKCDKMQSDLSLIDSENETLSVKKKGIEEFLHEEEQKVEKIRELAATSAHEAKRYRQVAGLRKALMLSILKFRENKQGLVEAEARLSEDVQKLQQEAASGRAALQELSSKKSSLQQNIATFEQRMLFIDKRLPELEAEKKVAASARNFKEAGRIAAEAKSLSLEKEGLQKDMERAMLLLGKLEEDIKKTVDSLQENEEQISLKEREVATAQFQRLLIIAKTAKAERAAAVEFGDMDEANLLLAEAEAAESEAKKLQPLYNLQEEDFANLPKNYIPLELISSLREEQLAEVASTAHLPAS